MELFTKLSDRTAEQISGGSHEAFDPGQEGKGATHVYCIDDIANGGRFGIVTGNGTFKEKDPSKGVNGFEQRIANGNGTVVDSGNELGLC